MHILDQDFSTLITEASAPGVLRVTLNRPETLNAMTPEMFSELEHLAAAVGQDAQVRAVVLTGAGRGFCSGYDLAMAERLPDMSATEFLDLQEGAARALSGIRSLHVPVIAAVNGAASGGGFSLSLACDIRLASTHAKFNAAFVKIGLSAGDLGLSWLLPRAIGPSRAAEIALTGRMVRADEAERIGLVNTVHAPEDLLEAADTVAGRIAGNSPLGVRMSKRALQANLEIPSYRSAMELENRGQTLLTRTEDVREAFAAFTQRREANFRNR